MIELIAARGNTSLESAVTLTKDIRWEIQALGIRLSKAANEEELLRRGSKRAKSREQNELELKLVISDVRKLLDRIEDAVPLMNLAITTSGVNLSTNLPATVSPSRLLQASTFLTGADSQYTETPGKFVQVGPVYTLSMYMLFAGHANRPHDEDSIRETTWKEVIHKARVKLVRVPLDKLYHLPGEEPHINAAGPFPEPFPGEVKSGEFAYQLMFVEDLDDGRVHSFGEDEPQPGPFEDIPLAGIRDVVPIHQVSKIFYADTGKILNIGTEGETNSPVLLVKRDVHAEPPRRMMERRESERSDDEYELENSSDHDHDDGRHERDDDSDDDYEDEAELNAQFERESTPATPADELQKQLEAPPPDDAHVHWRLPIDLDPEWIAFEVYNEDPDTDDDEEEDDSTPVDSTVPPSRSASLGPTISTAFANLHINTPSPARSQTPAPPAPTGPIKTSLSLLEMLIRLTALQQFRQASHLTIEDELLNFFLEDSATTGAGANAQSRQRIRRDARRRVGFDPYDESPIKRRGEEYLAHPRAGTEDWAGREQRQGSWFDGEGRGGVRESIEGGSERRYRSSTRHSSSSSSGIMSSPSPLARPQLLTSRSSPARSEGRRSVASMATPPSSARKGNLAGLRDGRYVGVGSPLAREVRGGSAGSGSGTERVDGEE